MQREEQQPEYQDQREQEDAEEEEEEEEVEGLVSRLPEGQPPCRRWNALSVASPSLRKGHTNVKRAVQEADTRVLWSWKQGRRAEEDVWSVHQSVSPAFLDFPVSCAAWGKGWAGEETVPERGYVLTTYCEGNAKVPGRLRRQDP